MRFKAIVILLALIIISLAARAQEFSWKKPDSLFKYVQPVASLQFWSLYTMNERSQFTPNGPLEPAADRMSFMVRRARFGFKGKPYPGLNYVVMIQYDNLGKDKLSGARGGTNIGTLGILDMYVTYNFGWEDRLSITTGYFHPQVSRECITGDMNVTSFDKGITQSYIRQHITGKSYGRTTGVNLGGMMGKDLVTIGYNFGIFNNNTTAADTKALPESTGRLWSPLLAARVTISFGDPDMKKYSINYSSNNYFNERKGVTFGFNSSQQGRTDIFRNNSSLGGDILLNYRNLNLDAEWMSLKRTVEGTSTKSQTFQIRAGYNLIISKKFFIEPTVMSASFENRVDGVDRNIDFGVNWYLNKKECKIIAHYVKQSGHGDNGYTDGTTFKKGDFAGVGMVMLF